MKFEATTVTKYLADAPNGVRPVPRKLRTVIRKDAPGAHESMRYGMPIYDLDDEMLCAFAVQKGNLAFYFRDMGLVARFQGKIGSTGHGKSCLRFRKPERIPVAVLERIIRAAVKRWVEGH